jgi:hypothetical protein
MLTNCEVSTASRFDERHFDFFHSNVACWPIPLKKSFWGDERNFLEPLTRFTRGDVRDHIDSPKSTTKLRSGAQ